MPRFLTVLGLYLSSSIAIASSAPAHELQSAVTREFTDASAAFAAARTATATATLDQLFHASGWLATPELTHELNRILTELSPPEAEYVVHEWLRGIRDQPAQRSVKGALQQLRSYRSRTLVPHGDISRARKSVFPIAAHAAGILHQWQFAEFRDGAVLALQHQDSKFWNQLPSKPSASELAGLQHALTHSELGLETSEKLFDWSQTVSAYSALAIPLALKSAQVAMLNQALVLNPSQRVKTLMHLGDHWSAERASEIWEFWLGSADTTAAAAAMVQLSRSQGTQILFDHLAHSGLGGAAASELALHLDDQSQSRLVNLANQSEGLTAARAQLALRMIKARQPSVTARSNTNGLQP